jgi:hypothetical protein
LSQAQVIAAGFTRIFNRFRQRKLHDVL